MAVPPSQGAGKFLGAWGHSCLVRGGSPCEAAGHGATPLRVRGMLLAAIAYFILPFDFVPDIIAGLGFADDAALVTAVVALVSAHITPTHRAAAARALDKELPKTT